MLANSSMILSLEQTQEICFLLSDELTGYGLLSVPYLMILDRKWRLCLMQKVLADFPEAEIDSRIQSLR